MADGAEGPDGAIVGVGVDLMEISRMAAVLARTPSIEARLFRDAEREACGGRVDRLAARFAAKEAVAKALGTGVRGFAFRDVELVADEIGKPSVVLHGAAADVAAARGVSVVHVSMSHSRETVVAYAVAERRSPDHG